MLTRHLIARLACIARLDGTVACNVVHVSRRFAVQRIAHCLTNSAACKRLNCWSSTCPEAGHANRSREMRRSSPMHVSTDSPLEPAPTGSPPKLQTPVADDSNTYFNLGGGLTFDSLTKLANITYAAGANASTIQPSTQGGVCNTADTRNWGEPWRPPTIGTVVECESRYPIIWAKGNFQFS